MSQASEKREGLLHHEAFLVFVSMSKPSTAGVQRELKRRYPDEKIGYKLVTRWRKEFEWDQRYQQTSLKLTQATDAATEELVESYRAVNARHLYRYNQLHTLLWNGLLRLKKLDPLTHVEYVDVEDIQQAVELITLVTRMERLMVGLDTGASNPAQVNNYLMIIKQSAQKHGFNVPALEGIEDATVVEDSPQPAPAG